MSEEFAVEGEDADVAVGDEEHDAGAGVGAADAYVSQLGFVAERDAAGLVDLVVADAEVGCG